MGKDAINALNIRAWIVKGGVRYDHAPFLLTLGKFGDPSQTLGEEGRISAPDPGNFDRDVQVGTTPGTEERATLSLSERFTTDKNTLLDLAQGRCRFDIFALIGKCGSPSDFTLGGSKRTYFPDAKASSKALENFGAFGRDENNPTNANIDVTSRTFWEVLYETISQKGAASTTREIMTIDVYHTVSCGNCGIENDGCQVVLATMAGTGATPGTKPILLWSQDGGDTWTAETISSMFSTETITGAHIIGSTLYIITSTGNEIHYTNIEKLLIGQNTWSQTDTGFVVGGEPQAIWSAGPRATWIVGNAGYVYFAESPNVKVTVQDAGVATTQNLLDVHAYDEDNVLAVGNSNATLLSRNGGKTWDAITGPSVGINLGACWMWSEDVWFIGEGPGGAGVLYGTLDGGFNFDTISLPVTIDQIDRIMFVSEAEGYLAGRSGGSSVIFRTVTGGYEWIALPDGPDGLTIPDNDYITDLAVCIETSNTAFGSGLAGDATAGIILKATAD